ncbi:metalloregulator ArsR/SmtB family transcription factor [Paucibacter soli]|uniref:metalloregulator ArsR/SmtB family transcription factor n=1 Tax=Paucibacter soli TaxID=3133433 RepID=UPI00309AE73B
MRSKLPPATDDVSPMREHAREATALLKALGNEDRLLILCTLSQGELSVGELEQRTQIHQPTLSQQLTVLRDQAMVSCRRDGRFAYYSVSSPAALATIATLYELFCARSAGCEIPQPQRRAGKPPS